MSTLEEMPVCRVLEGYGDWEIIIEKADPHLGPQSGVIVMKNELLQRPDEYFNDTLPCTILSYPERQGQNISFSSWRIRDYPGKGYHIHEFDEFYLLHRDEFDPKNYLSAILHLVFDTSLSEKIILGGATYIIYRALKRLVGLG